MTMITPSYLGETIEYSSLHACRSTLEDPTPSLVPQSRMGCSKELIFYASCVSGSGPVSCKFVTVGVPEEVQSAA